MKAKYLRPHLETHIINSAFERVSKQLGSFRNTCDIYRSPLRSVTYRVLDNGETRISVRYKKK